MHLIFHRTRTDSGSAPRRLIMRKPARNRCTYYMVRGMHNGNAPYKATINANPCQQHESYVPLSIFSHTSQFFERQFFFQCMWSSTYIHISCSICPQNTRDSHICINIWCSVCILVSKRTSPIDITFENRHARTKQAMAKGPFGRGSALVVAFFIKAFFSGSSFTG